MGENLAFHAQHQRGTFDTINFGLFVLLQILFIYTHLTHLPKIISKRILVKVRQIILVTRSVQTRVHRAVNSLIIFNIGSCFTEISTKLLAEISEIQTDSSINIIQEF